MQPSGTYAGKDMQVHFWSRMLISSAELEQQIFESCSESINKEKAMSSISDPLFSAAAKSYASPIEKPRTGRDVTINVLSCLAHQGLDSWEDLNRVATDFKIDRSDSVITHYLGTQILQKPDYNNWRVRQHVLLEAINEACDLPPEELIPLLNLSHNLGRHIDDSQVQINRHLDLLDIGGEARAFWQKELSKPTIPKFVCSYLPLLRDPRLFEMASAHPYPLVALLIDQLVRTQPSIDPIQIKQLLNDLEIPLLGALIQDSIGYPQLQDFFLPLLGLLDREQVIKVDAIAHCFGEDKHLQSLMVLFFVSKTPICREDKLLSALDNLVEPQRQQILVALSAHPELLSPPLISKLRDKLFAGAMSEQTAQLIRENVKSLQGDRSDCEVLIKALFRAGDSTNSALYRLEILYALSASQIHELAQVRPAELVNQMIFMALDNESSLSLEKKQHLLSQLDAPTYSQWLTACFKTLYDSPLENGRYLFSLLYKKQMSTQQRDHILELHFQHMGLDVDSSSRCKQLLKDTQKKISPWVYENLFHALPLLNDQLRWKALESSPDPITALMSYAFDVTDSRGTPLLGAPLLLPSNSRITWPPTGYREVYSRDLFLGEDGECLTMYALALMHPRLKPLFQHDSGFDRELFPKLIGEMGWPPRLAVAYLLAAGSEPKEVFDRLAPQEKADLFQLMMTTPLESHWSVWPLFNATMAPSLMEVYPSIIAKALEKSKWPASIIAPCVEALQLSSPESPILWQTLAPHLCRLKPEELTEINLRGSPQALLVSLIIKVLENPENAPIESPTNQSPPLLAQHLKLMKVLPSEIRFQLHTALISHPKASSTIFQQLVRMVSVNLSIDSSGKDSWGPYLKSQLGDLKLPQVASPLQVDLEREWSSAAESHPTPVTSSWIESLEREGWKPCKVLGRTHIYEREGKYRALKWQKADEPVADLFKEMATLQVLKKHQKSLGLVSDYPTPVGIYQFEGPLAAGYFDSTPVVVQAQSSEAIAYVYECATEDYFIYLHDPLASVPSEEAAERYALARHAMMTDLFILAKNGLIMTQLADIFHRSETSRSERDDQGRYRALNSLVGYQSRSLISSDVVLGIGNGRLHHLERAVEYMNAGYSGLRDMGDSQLLSDLGKAKSAFSATYFSELFRSNPGGAQASILANFLAEYLLVYELAITERLVNTADNELDWQNPEKVELLAQQLREGFETCMTSYSGISTTLARRFLDHAGIDWTRASVQLHFWSRKDEKGYLPFEPSSLPPEIYGTKTIVRGSPWGPKGMSDSGQHYEGHEEEGASAAPDLSRHRGTYSGTDPVKEGERSRALVITHLLMLDQARQVAKEHFQEGQKIKSSDAEEIRRAIGYYERSLEFWPFDKGTYAALEKAYTELGEVSQAQACKEQKAALILQNAWHRYAQKKQPAARKPVAGSSS